MQKAKPWIALLLALLLFVLSGCSSEAPAGTTAPGSTEASGGGTAADLHQKNWIWAKNSTGAFNDTGYYYITQDGFLCFADIRSGLSVYLCSIPGCLHNQEEDPFKMEQCEARVTGSALTMPVFFWDDCIYYIEEDEYGTQLYRRSQDGLNLKKVCTLGTAYTKDQKSVSIFSFALSDGHLYYDAEVSASIMDEHDVYTVKRELCYIGRVDLQSGKDQIIYTDTESFVTLCAAAEDCAMFLAYDDPELDPDDPDYAEASLNRASRLLFWCEESPKAVPVFEKTVRECLNITMVSDRYVYYTGAPRVSQATYRYDLETKEETKVSDNTVRHINGQYALRLEEDGSWVLYDFYANLSLPNELTKDLLTVGTVSESCFILQRTIRGGGSGSRRVYCHVAYTSLADGLQEADLTPLYTRQNSTAS